MEDYGFEYSDEEQEEQDVDIENQYYNSKGMVETEPESALSGFAEVVKMEPEKAECKMEKIDMLWMHSDGPGLSLCLRVGVRKARRVAGNFNLPIVGVHHMEAHALVARLVEQDLSFPFMALLISGGHNLLVLAHKLGQYTQLGTTVDDAIGEAFDKTAKWLGLDMHRSGGPAVEELALEGDAKSLKFN